MQRSRCANSSSSLKSTACQLDVVNERINPECQVWGLLEEVETVKSSTVKPDHTRQVQTRQAESVGNGRSGRGVGGGWMMMGGTELTQYWPDYSVQSGLFESDGLFT